MVTKPSPSRQSLRWKTQPQSGMLGPLPQALPMTTRRILLLNDLHLEFQDYTPVQEGYDLVVLAGDIHTKERGVLWALENFSKPVVYVPGNHEGYKTHWQKNLAKMKALAAGTHVHVLNQDVVELEGIRFLGATCWTTFQLWDNVPEAMYEAGRGRYRYERGAKDYGKIRTAGYRHLTPSDTAQWAFDAKRWVEARLAEPFSGPTVIVSHHAPSALSLKKGRVTEALDATDANPWDDLVANSGAAFWMHGHTHRALDYKIGNTRVISNPRGYPGEEVYHFPQGIWEVDTAAYTPPAQR